MEPVKNFSVAARWINSHPCPVPGVPPQWLRPVDQEHTKPANSVFAAQAFRQRNKK